MSETKEKNAVEIDSWELVNIGDALVQTSGKVEDIKQVIICAEDAARNGDEDPAAYAAGLMTILREQIGTVSVELEAVRTIIDSWR